MDLGERCLVARLHLDDVRQVPAEGSLHRRRHAALRRCESALGKRRQHLVLGHRPEVAGNLAGRLLRRAGEALAGLDLLGRRLGGRLVGEDDLLELPFLRHVELVGARLEVLADLVLGDGDVAGDVIGPMRTSVTERYSGD